MLYSFSAFLSIYFIFLLLFSYSYPHLSPLLSPSFIVFIFELYQMTFIPTENISFMDLVFSLLVHSEYLDVIKHNAYGRKDKVERSGLHCEKL